MPHVDYLSRLLMDYQMLYKPEKPTEEIFIGQVCLNRKIKYVMTFIYNAYRSWMLIKTDWNKEMYSLHQLSGKGIESKDSNSLEAALRELRKETGLRIYHLRVKWIGYDEKYDCNIYAIELDIGKNPQ